MLNKHEVIGRVGQEVEIRFSKSGEQVATYSVATTEKWKDKNGQRQEDTQWHDIVCFGRLAEISGEYLQKGSLVFVCGQQIKEHWNDKDGNKRVTNKLKAREMKMLSPKDSQQSNYKPEPKTNEWVPF